MKKDFKVIILVSLCGMIYSCTTPKIYTDYTNVKPVINFNLCGIGPLVPKFSTEEDVRKFLGKPDFYEKKWVHRCAICLKERALKMYYTRYGLEIYLTRGVRRHDKRTIFYMKVDSTSQLKTDSGFGIGSNLKQIEHQFGDVKLLGYNENLKNYKSVSIYYYDQLARYVSFSLFDYSNPKSKEEFRVNEIWLR